MGNFPPKVIVCVPFTRNGRRWKLEMEIADADCVLTPQAEA
jgi:hypothetical protein